MQLKISISCAAACEHSSSEKGGTGVRALRVMTVQAESSFGMCQLRQQDEVIFGYAKMEDSK